jgi:hypothetical protein
MIKNINFEATFFIQIPILSVFLIFGKYAVNHEVSLSKICGGVKVTTWLQRLFAIAITSSTLFLFIPLGGASTETTGISKASLKLLI